MRRVVGMCSVLIVLGIAVRPAGAELMGPAAPVGDESAGLAELRRSEGEVGWHEELAQWFSGGAPQSGDLMAVVLPGPRVRPPSPAPPPPPPVVVSPPPVVPPPVVPPPVFNGEGRTEGDVDRFVDVPPGGGAGEVPEVPPIPEPGSMVLLAVAGAGMLGFRCRRRQP